MSTVRLLSPCEPSPHTDYCDLAHTRYYLGMFGNHSFERVRDLFSDQFEPNGHGFTYRKGMKGAPIGVSQSERDTFIADFNRRLRYAIWGILPALLMLVVVVAVIAPDPDDTAFSLSLYGGAGIIFTLFMALYYWAWNAPARSLARRPALGLARSRAEVRQLMLVKTTYGQLAAAVFGMIAVLFTVSEKTDIFRGWGRLWLGFAIAIVIAIALQAFRKWRFDRSAK